MKTPDKVLSLSIVLLCSTAFAETSPTAADRFREAVREAGSVLNRAKGALTQEAHDAWEKTQAYLSDDPATYRDGAANSLQEWGAEIAQLQQQSAAVAPDRVYLHTLLAALEQQRAFAVQQLATLTPEQVHQGRDGARRALDETMHRLEAHLDLAREELQGLIGIK